MSSRDSNQSTSVNRDNGRSKRAVNEIKEKLRRIAKYYEDKLDIVKKEKSAIEKEEQELDTRLKSWDAKGTKGKLLNVSMFINGQWKRGQDPDPDWNELDRIRDEVNKKCVKIEKKKETERRK